MLGSPAAQRKSSSSALHEAGTLVGACAGTGRTHSPATPTRAVTSKSDVPLRQPLDLARVLAKLATVLDEPRSSRSLEEVQSGYGSGNNGNEVHRGLRRRIRRRRAPAAGQPRPDAHSTQPSRTFQSYHRGAQDGGTRRADDSSRGRHAEEYLLHRCGHLLSLRWVSVMVTGDLDEGRIGGCERPPARDTLSDARVCGKGQLLGLSDPRRPTRRPLAARRSLSSHRMAQGIGCARNSKEAMHGVGLRSGCPSPALDQTSLR